MTTCSPGAVRAGIFSAVSWVMSVPVATSIVGIGDDNETVRYPAPGAFHKYQTECPSGSPGLSVPLSCPLTS
jgi:hypothetical protein